MAPKFPLSRGFSDREKNSSILVENDLDLTDCWNERVPQAASRWRLSCPDKKRATPTWSSRLSSLSSNLRGLTTRAKQLQVSEATRRVITQLRSSMVEPSTPDESLPRAAASMSTQHFNESDFGDFSDQPETEDESCDDCYTKKDKRSSLRASRSWALNPLETQRVWVMGKHERDERPSRLDKKFKKHKRHHEDDKKKKHKKHKDRKSHRRHKRSRDSDSDSDSDGPVPDYHRAMKVVRELLTETPELAKDLLGLLQMVDDGQVAVIGGIENKRIKSKLKELFPLLGLVKLREPKGAFAKPKKGKEESGDSLMEVFQRMLTGSSDEQVASKHTMQAKPGETTEVNGSNAGEEKPVLPKTSKREMPIGPALPPSSARIPTADNGVDDDDDDEEVVGPALPGMRGFRLADERVEAEMARKAELLEKEQWERARDVGNTNKTDNAGVAPLAREAWMTMMPESSILKDSLGPQNRPPPGKPAAFRSKEPAAVDKTWFDSPEERERAKRAKLDMELLGYVREENKPVAAAASSVTATTCQPSVNESILPNANPEADEEMRKQMENLRKARGPSLLEQHQRKQAEEAKHGATSPQSSGGWNRDRDLTARRGMSGDDAERMITAAKQINSKFTAPTISRQFL